MRAMGGVRRTCRRRDRILLDECILRLNMHRRQVLLGKDPWELGYHVNGVLHESCNADNTTINTLRNLSAAAGATPRAGANFSGPLIYECHGHGNLNEVAAFLIGAGCVPP